MAVQNMHLDVNGAVHVPPIWRLDSTKVDLWYKKVSTRMGLNCGRWSTHEAVRRAA